MKNILSPRTARVLADAGARRSALLGFDFDGTLAPHRRRPRAPPRCGQRPAPCCASTALLYPCAVMSGRRRADVLGRLDGVPLVGVIGNHGAEAGFGPVDLARGGTRSRPGWRRSGRTSEGVKGVRIEDKELSRGRALPPGAGAILRRATRILAAARRLPGARVFGGKAVVNVVPGDAHDKGDAVARLLPRAMPPHRRVRRGRRDRRGRVPTPGCRRGHQGRPVHTFRRGVLHPRATRRGRPPARARPGTAQAGWAWETTSRAWSGRCASSTPWSSGVRADEDGTTWKRGCAGAAGSRRSRRWRSSSG